MHQARFYSSVILNGTETFCFVQRYAKMFYSSVILNGTETCVILYLLI